MTYPACVNLLDNFRNEITFQVILLYEASGRDRSSETVIFQTGFYLSEHLGFSKTYISLTLSRNISFTKSDPRSLLDSIVTMYYGGASPMILLERSLLGVAPNNFLHQLDTDDDHTLTPSEDICVPQYYSHPYF